MNDKEPLILKENAEELFPLHWKHGNDRVEESFKWVVQNIGKPLDVAEGDINMYGEIIIDTTINKRRLRLFAPRELFETKKEVLLKKINNILE